MDSEPLRRATGFATLRQFVPTAPLVERCGMCSARVAEVHQHLVDLDARTLVCACQACSILFNGQSNARYKRVPRDLRRIPDLRLTEETWESLSIPISMAFLFYNSRAGKPVAVYPSPAGAIESSLSLAAWDELRLTTPALRVMEPDVEALLVNRLSAQAPEYFIAPIDECHKLVGLVRTHWRGLAGGEVWMQLERFFGGLRQRATYRTREVPHA
jgi:hypothetical protein